MCYYENNPSKASDKAAHTEPNTTHISGVDDNRVPRQKDKDKEPGEGLYRSEPTSEEHPPERPPGRQGGLPVEEKIGKSTAWHDGRDDDDCETMLVLVDLVSEDEAEENAKSIETDDDVILEISMWFPRGFLESVSTWIPLDFSIDEGPSSQPIRLEQL